MNIILIGFKSSGKTTVGRLLAKKLQRSFYDSDDLLEKAFFNTYNKQLNFREIYSQYGEEVFATLERLVVKQLTEIKHSIISVGGRTVLNPENAKKLKAIGTLVWLHVDKEVLKKRIFSKQLPAYFDKTNPDTYFELEYMRRLDSYANIADITLSVGKESIEEIVALIISALGK